MAGKKENLKALFTNTRTRVIIVFTAVLLIFAIIFGLTKFIKLSSTSSTTSSVSATPSIQSIPGALNPSEEYAKLQEKQNVTQASEALKTGGSAIPTIVSSQIVGEGVGSIGSQTGQGGVGFTTLVREAEAGPQQNAWLLELQNGNCNAAVIKKVMDEGAQISDVQKTCNCAQLKAAGLPLSELQKVCACKELKAAGFNALQLKEVGLSVANLRACGFNACELKSVGFTALEMKDGGFSDGELKGSGFSDQDIAKASGIPDGMTAADIRKAGCSVEALARLRAQGVSASAIRRINGCSASQLKAAGYGAKDLMQAGFTAADLKNAGFSPKELLDAGFSPRELLDAGFTPQDLANAGVSQNDIAAAETGLPPGISAEDVKQAGCDVETLKNERLAGVSAKAIRQIAGCSAAALKAAGFTDADLANAGFTKDQIAEQLPDDAAIKKAGCAPEQLKRLYALGVSAKKIRELNGCSAAQLRAAGFGAKALMDAGFTPQELLAAGVGQDEIDKAMASKAALLAAARNSDCSVASLTALRKAGLTAADIKKTLGCNANAMKAAGFNAQDLKAAGFTAGELANAGFTPEQLKAAGFSAKELKDAGIGLADLKRLGFSPKELLAAGFAPEELKAAGFTAQELKNAGLSAADLKKAGFSPKDLKEAGFSDDEIKAAGFMPNELAAAGIARALVGAEATQVVGLGAAPGAVGASSSLLALPLPPGQAAQAAAAQASNKQLQDVMARQRRQLMEQKYQQQIQQRTSELLGAANQAIQTWRQVPVQTYVAGKFALEADKLKATGDTVIVNEKNVLQKNVIVGDALGPKALIRAGEILFAVIDTSVNSDEPSPVLATVVSGRFKGARLIGSFNLPGNANKMIVTFNMMSVPGSARTTSISAVAIDSDTARTALSSRTNHHYLQRYGSLFAASFLQGFGNAFQSENTTVTIGGTTAGPGTVTVSNGVGRSVLENAVIGLTTLGQNWAQVAMQQVNRPTTVEIYSGAGVGVLFTQDLVSL